MKKTFFYLFITTLVAISCNKENNYDPFDNEENGALLTKSSYSADTGITKEEALRIVEPISNQYSGQWVEISQEPIPASSDLFYTELGIKLEGIEPSKIVSPPFDSWVLVIDPDYRFNGGQKQLHLFVDVETGEIEQEWVQGRVLLEWDTSRNIYTEQKAISTSPAESIETKANASTSNLWAVIISGGVDPDLNWKRYWNDCQDIYIKLTQNLGYLDSHIFCLVSDGTSSGYDRRTGVNTYDSSPLDFDNDGDNDIQYSATKSNISTVFTNLSSLVSAGDEVLVFVTDHGLSNGNAGLWNGATLSPYELNTQLNKLGSNVKIDVVMGQCYSGAFLSPILAANRTIATACTEYQLSSGNAIDGYDYFLHYWTESLTASNSGTIKPDPDGDGYRSLLEMYYYAKRKVEAIINTEHAQFNFDSDTTHISTQGFGHDLMNNLFFPALSGSGYASTNDNATYTLSGVPSSSTITWDHTSNLSVVSSSNSSITVKGIITSPSQFVISSGISITASFNYCGKDIDINKYLQSIWKPGLYTGYGYVSGSNGVYNVPQYPGAYGYYWWTDNANWTILSQGSALVYVTEGSTYDPVNLSCGLFDPFGGTIVLTDRVH